MTLLADFAMAISTGRIGVVDLTAPLSANTPVLVLPEPFGQTDQFELREISHYDDRGPAWYWNNITTGEHTGTHLDAPIHWITGRELSDVSQIAPSQLIASAAVIDVAEQVAADPDFLLEVDHVKAWEDVHGPLPESGWLLLRTGWDSRSHRQDEFLNADETGPHTPGVSVECARWLAEETVGTDAGVAHSFDPAFPCHTFLLGAGKYGLTQLQNLASLPPTGAVVIAAPLPILGGSGSPTRVLALIEY